MSVVLGMTGGRKNVHNGAGRDLDPKGARTSTRALEVTGNGKNIHKGRRNVHNGTQRDLNLRGARTCTMVLEVASTSRAQKHAQWY